MTLGDRLSALDRWLVGAVLAGALLRAVPLWVWPQLECVRDECIYRYLASNILNDGVLGVTTKGWLAAPGYPYLLAFLKAVTGSWQPVKFLQVALSLTSIPVMYALGREVVAGEAGRRAGRWAAWGFALHPTLAWYTNTQWIETIYVAFLLPAALAALRARRATRPGALAAVAGLLLAVCILFRGVATWLPPLFALALVWPEGEAWKEAIRARAKPASILVLTALLAVAPYSVFASRRYGGPMVSDATAGHVIFLGNNDFPPMTFDYGIGALTQPLYYRTIRTGRPPCPRDLPPVVSDRCEVRAALAWIRENPAEFTRRVPHRLAQQLNPNTFLTREIRWGHLEGIPWQLKELACALIAAVSAVVVLGGSFGGLARGRGPYAVVAGGTIAYTMATAAVTYGMSRFRLPLEPLWMVWLGVLLAEPRETWRALHASAPRSLAAVIVLPVLAGLMAWFAPTGFPMFWR